MEPKTLSEEVHNTRPSDKRIPSEESVYDLLEELSIEYLRTDHPPTATMEECAAIGRRLNVSICKNLFLTNRQETVFYLLLMPGTKPFKTKDLSKQIGSSRLSFAGADHMLRLLDITPGSVSVLGLMNDRENAVHLLIDRELLRDEWLCCHPCINSSTVKFSMADAMNVLIPALGNDLQFVELPRYDA